MILVYDLVMPYLMHYNETRMISIRVLLNEINRKYRI